MAERARSSTGHWQRRPGVCDRRRRIHRVLAVQEHGGCSGGRGARGPPAMRGIQDGEARHPHSLHIRRVAADRPRRLRRLQILHRRVLLDSPRRRLSPPQRPIQSVARRPVHLLRRIPDHP